MGFVDKLMGTARMEQPEVSATNFTTTADGAIDTLGTIMRTMGDASFAIDDGHDVEKFRDQCAEIAGHIENGAPAPAAGIEQADDGDRRWGHIRRFYVERRRSERDFVANRLTDFRHVVGDLIGGLREISRRDDETAGSVNRNLKAVEAAVQTGQLPEIQSSLNQAMRNIGETFAQQRHDYERQIAELNKRMAALRDDLTSAREEMKRDALTGAYNRGAFDATIQQSLNLNFILDQAVTVIFIDLDYFKEVNDSYGHTAGDEVLRAVGDALTRCFIRKTDVVARYGGDEFAVILADTSPDDAANLLKRFYESLPAIRLGEADEDFELSCSAGYTEIVAGDSVESLVRRLDGALYSAKADGRGRFRYAPPPSHGGSFGLDG